ncbi:MAG: hypothetical protein P9L96_00220 [Candidatus Gygaella obscura]|nr:hypothetical protein [Candidatus Gygaella obscura]
MEKRRFYLFIFFVCLSVNLSFVFAAEDSKKENKSKAYYEKQVKGGYSSYKKNDSKLPELELSVILSGDCKTCDTNSFLKRLKKYFSKVNLTTVDLSEAEEIVKQSGIKSLPIYFIAKELAVKEDLEKISSFIVEKDFGFVFKPQFSGMTFLLDRQLKKGKIDLFISLFEEDSPQIISNLKELNPQVHFLAIKRGNEFIARSGKKELEEINKAVCIEKYYPDEYLDYLSCRVNNIKSSWWDECIKDVDYKTIKQCAMGEELKSLLGENLNLVMELNVFSQATVLLENRELFHVLPQTTADGLEHLLSK